MSEFKITGPGLYKDTFGNHHLLSPAKGSWVAKMERGYIAEWDDNGKKVEIGCVIEHGDIIARVDGPQEMAGFDGGYAIACERTNGAFEVYGHGHPSGARKVASGFMERSDAKNATVIDLSKVPASAIVRPEPKRVRGWVNVYPSDSQLLSCVMSETIWRTRAEADNYALKERIACIEVDFVEGEGL